MNHRDFMAKKDKLVAEYHDKTKEHESLYAPVEALEAQVTRTWVAWDWKFQIAPGNFIASRDNGERYVSGLYEIERDRAGMRTAGSWHGAIAMAGVLFLYHAWLEGHVAELPASGDLISALVPRQGYPDHVKTQCERLRALLAGS